MTVKGSQNRAFY